MKKYKQILLDSIIFISIPFILELCGIGFSVASFKSWFLYIILVVITELIIKFIQSHKKSNLLNFYYDYDNKISFHSLKSKCDKN